MSYFPRRALLVLVVGLAVSSGCVAPVDADLDSVEQALTTTQIFPTTTLPRGASKSGTFVAFETGTLTYKTAGTGDADLYVKRGTGASRTSYDCKSESSTSTEQCTLSVTADTVTSYHVYAYANATVSLNVTSEATSTEPNTTSTTLVPSTAMARGTSQTGVFTAPAAGDLVFKSSGTGDVDLYLKRGTIVTITSNECESEGATAVETCRITVTAGQQVAWLLYAYAKSTASLTVTAPTATSTTR